MNKQQYELIYDIVVNCGIGSNEFFYPKEVGKTKEELSVLGYKYLKHGINGSGNSYVRLTQEAVEDMNVYRERELEAYILGNPQRLDEGWDD